MTAKRFSFLLVAKPGDHKSLYQDLAVLRRANLLDRHTTEHRQERREYEWVTDLPLNGNPNSPHINFIRLRIVKAGKTYENAWVTDLAPTSANIVQLVRAARARWKIVRAARARWNERLRNTLKNQGWTTWSTISVTATSICRRRSSPSTCLGHAFFIPPDLRTGGWPVLSASAPSSVPAAQFWDEVRSAFRTVSVYLLGPSVGAHELAAAAAIAPLRPASLVE